MRNRGFKYALVVAGLSAFSSMASAGVLLDTIEGNDCAGVFNPEGSPGFPNCVIPTEFDPDNSPVIIKFNTPGATEINTDLFPTIDGSEFSFTGTGGSFGTWTYAPNDPEDPAINFYVAKGGPNFNLFANDGDPNSDDWYTPGGATGGGPGLSHITFYDTGGGEIPEPGSLALLGVGLLGVAGLMARRRRSAG